MRDLCIYGATWATIYTNYRGMNFLREHICIGEMIVLAPQVLCRVDLLIFLHIHTKAKESANNEANELLGVS